MANTVFKLRRSSVAGKLPNTSTLSIGELAINLTDRKLFSSDGTDIFETGSNLTSLSVFSDISVGNSAVNTTINSTALSVKSIVANGGVGSATQVLSSNGSGIYWASPTAGSGTVTSVATGNGLTGGPITTTGTVSVLANTGIVANSTGLFVNSSYIATLTANNTSFVGSVSAANVVSNAQLSANLANYQTTAGLSANVATLTSNSATFLGSSITFGNSTGIFTTGTINSASFTVGTSTIANSTGVYTGIVNGSTISVGTSVIANTSRLVIGTGVGVQANGGIGTAGQILTSNGTTVYWSTVTSSVAGSNTQIQFNDSGTANATAGFTFDKTSNTLSVGNTTVNTTANSASVLPGIMYHNYQTINIDYTVANNYSASMVGPVTVATGKTLTINSGARFVVI